MAVLGRHDEESKGGDIIVDRKGSTSPGGMTPEEQILSDPEDVGHSLHRGLRSRQVTMIAIGGAIGTGLIIGTGSALAKAGPGSLMIAYTFVGFIVFLVMAALGEMAAWLPAAGGFSVYATRFVDPALGFSLGYTYWFKYIITTPNQLTAAALVIQFWLPATKVNPGVFIAIFLVVIVAINYFGIKFFGEFEFWLSSIKVLVICGLILLSLILALGGGPDHDRKGFRYWKKPGAFAPYLTTGSLGQFLGFWSTMVNAVFAYLGTELVGVTVGEAENPRKTIPRAIKLTFYRILFFYCFSVLLLGMIIAYDDDELVKATKQAYNSAAASPFVAAIRVSGINVLPGFLNACILIFVFSASNSDLYIASRTIHGLALKGHAPAILAKTDSRGVPYYSLGLSALFCCLAFMNVSSDSKTVFGYFVNLVTIFGLLTWISILVSHVYFVRARNAQGVDPKTLAYRAPFGVAGTYFALFFCILIALTKNFDVFVGGFKYKTFITGYLGIPLYLIMIFGYKFVKKTEGVKPEEADLWSGKDAIDRDEEMWKIKDAEKKASGVKDGGWFYRTFVSWLF
ncbi:hypothetical protein TWF106_000768 [Orbilia oligospora]|uniref:Amino acid permease/ SLC12A domain-containing protein n=1 Tax=Orbilia oligospora TaxID=2813651 RepID=A0A6G1M9T6_ORBOL|nr:hypothetical protein TWF788_005917 [Orbilia oligospora]KAF3182604.1 hypothetical protein TWF788_005917 [Orbilia oligospora]KAF3222974.1 hypothetical protein TWF679_004171 [Orbilia oligospora]KAF3226274.1 hypothetical protein TWF106_000768 [Orbilia oligospora]KAF3226700.1 hypothetical protein TWF191_004524 [Orbilia oligospora]